MISDYLDDSDRKDIHQYTECATELIKNNKFSSLARLGFADVPNVGLDVLSTLIRYYRTDDLHNIEPEIGARYARMAAICARVFQKSLDVHSPDHLFIPHNQYSPAGPAARIARKQHRSYFTYLSHHSGGLVFRTIQPDDICQSPYAITSTTWKKILNTSVDTGLLQQQTSDFFNQRYTKFSGDMEYLLGKIEKCDFNSKIFLTQKTQKKKRKFVIFTHLNWDNAFIFGETPFISFAEWIDFTIKTIINIDNVEWLIRIHPVEFFSDSLANMGHGVYAQIQKNFPRLPKHIVVIPPDSTINPLDFLLSCDGVISCCGTSGLEAAALGKIAINAAAGYYSQRGFTYDPMCEPGNALDNYAALLGRASVLPMPTEEQTRAARTFLLTFFNERGSRELHYANNLGLQVNHPWQLLRFLPGRNAEMDRVCEGFLTGTDILFAGKAQ